MTAKERYESALNIMRDYLTNGEPGAKVTYPSLTLLLAGHSIVLSPQRLADAANVMIEEGRLDRITQKTFRVHLDEPQPEPEPMDAMREAMSSLMARLVIAESTISSLTTRLESLEKGLGVVTE